MRKEFVNTFDSDADSPDTKYGRRMYKALLQKVANRELEILLTDLNALKQFCEKEKAVLDQDIM